MNYECRNYESVDELMAALVMLVRVRVRVRCAALCCVASVMRAGTADAPGVPPSLPVCALYCSVLQQSAARRTVLQGVLVCRSAISPPGSMLAAQSCRPDRPSHLISSPLLNVAWWHTPTQFPTAKHCPRCAAARMVVWAGVVCARAHGPRAVPSDVPLRLRRRDDGG